MKLRTAIAGGACLLVLSIASCATSPSMPQDFSYMADPSTDAAAESGTQGGDGGASSGPSESESDASGGSAQTPAGDPSSRSADASTPSTWPSMGSHGDAAAPTDPNSSLYPPTNVTADAFCAKYQMYCGFGGSQRYANMSACVMNYNANPGQQGCYNYHLNAAISGTATLCTSPPTQQCFAIHCPHATGMGGYCM